MAPPVEINYLGVVVATVAAMIVGAIWYAPPVLGRKWMQLVGKTEEEARAAGMAKPMAVAIFSSLVMAVVMSFIVDYAEATKFSEGALVGVLVWVGFVATTLVTNAVFEGRSNELAIINGAHYLVVIVLVGGILAFFTGTGFSMPR